MASYGPGEVLLFYTEGELPELRVEILIVYQGNSVRQHPSAFLIDGAMQLQQKTGAVGLLSIRCSFRRRR